MKLDRLERTRLPLRSAALLALLALGLSSTPAAASGPPTGAPPSPNTNPLSNPQALFGQRQAATAAMTGGLLDGDLYLQATANFDLTLGKVGLGLQVPLNLLIWPIESPSRDHAAYWGVIRKADWPVPSLDNYSNYLRLVRYVRYGVKRDPLYVHFGQMYGSSLGHGTIIDRYNNSLDVNRPRSGLAVDVNAKGWGFETFVNDIAWPSTSILGLRGYVRPVALAGQKIPILDKWAIGVSATSDISAPSQYASDTATEARHNGYEVRDGVMIPVDPRHRTILGVDMEVEVLHNSIISLIPYTDFNWQLGAGAGLHLGTMANFRIPLFGALDLWSKLEYRVMQPGYIPNYFDSLYDLQRFAFPVGNGLMQPKADAHRLLAPNGNGDFGDLTHGILGEASVRVLGMIEAGATYWDTPGLENAKNLMVFLTLPKFQTLKLSAFYVRKNFDDVEDIIAFDERSVLTAAAMYRIFGPLYFLASFSRTWRVDEATGTIEGVNDFGFGIQTYFPL